MVRRLRRRVAVVNTVKHGRGIVRVGRVESITICFFSDMNRVGGKQEREVDENGWQAGILRR